MILVLVFEKGNSLPIGGEYFQPADALADLVSHLNGDTGITGIGPKSLTLDCPDLNERIEYEGDEDDMDLLQNVGLLYIQARAWLCGEADRKLAGE